ncbi:MAG: amidase family protein [Duodenibacillus sp.]
MIDEVFPLDAPLAPDVMLERLRSLAHRLRATNVWRIPTRDARFRILAKANIGTGTFPAHAGSLALADLLLPEAHCVRLLRAAGCDVFGTTTMTELAGFVTTRASEFGYSHLGGLPQNPHGPFPTRGSSAGSAAAVAAGLCDAALGTETRGSLMLPGLACGVVAYKPSRGFLSRSRIVPISSHFDAPGVLARSVATARTVASLMVGEDSEDPVTRVCRDVSLKPEMSAPMTERPRLAFLGSGRAIDALPAWLRRAADFVPVDYTEEDFGYKPITSLDIRLDMDVLLERYGSETTPRSFAQLHRFYREHPETHPFGMDRLDDAAAMTMVPRDALERLAQQSIARASEMILEVMEKTQADAVAADGFAVDWWSISGAPSVTVPIGKCASGRPTGLMMGSRFADDDRVLSIAQTLEDARRLHHSS